MATEEIVQKLQSLSVEDKPVAIDGGHGFSTCYVYDEGMMKHENIFDKDHPEVPARISRIYEKCQEYGLLKKCKRLPSRRATEEELLTLHSQGLIDRMKTTQTMKNRELSKFADSLDSIYLHPSTFECAVLAAGCTLTVVEEIARGNSMNGIAIVRPPGHHASHDVCSGFCYFNNVAIAAKKAQLQPNIDKVLIFDWDVHHGDGIQSLLYEDPSVLYFSIHRYDHANYYPFNEASNYDKIGANAGEGFNINVAWNKRRMGDGDYLAVFHHLLLPIAYEFNPDLVIVSAGFDSARGDVKGLCNITPECYAHMTKILMNLANGRIALVLEGGYNLNSNAESMASCLRVLLGEPCPPLEDAAVPCDSALESISDTMKIHAKYWKSLRIAGLIEQNESKATRAEQAKPTEKKVTSKKKGKVREVKEEKTE